ncbi:MarR family winged helix-turn-helix transcriptional regulator [Anaerosporobacter faecicola]|uniref:MarR family winged helix-turn-helix transcriptional regulator n=1 Tax=Anaerosporobacter faecicola TaxID=2718714 RepID=UPI00143B5718|nr:MarR family transcriptional regulator [Anaerosporobacter faecicola]
MDAYDTFHETLVSLFNDIMELEQKAIITDRFKNITNNDMHIIEAIGDKAAKNMSSVAKALKVTVGTLTIAINNLVKKGYVDRIRSEKDKRVVLISLSELGREAYVHHKNFHEKMIDAMMEGLDEHETNVLVKALTSLNQFFKSYQSDK